MVIKIFKNKHLPLLLALGFIIIALVFTRFYKLEQLFYFGIDEEYQSLLAWEQVKNFHPIWIGTSQANTGFYLGPGVVYWHAALLWISQGNPLILGITAGIVSMLFILTFFFTIKNFYTLNVAFLSSVFLIFTPFTLYYDRRFWNPTLVPFISFLFFLVYTKMKRYPNLILLLSFLIGLSFHVHASLFMHLPIALYFVVRYYICRRNIKHKYFLLLSGIFVFLVIYSPLIVYDYFHNFDNLLTPLRLLQQRSGQFKINQYYFLIITPYLTLIAGLFFSRTKKWMQILVVLAVIVWGSSYLFLQPISEGLTQKKLIIKKVFQELKGKPYILETSEDYLFFGGWRYLFKVYGYAPNKSQADSMFGWIYQDEIKNPQTKLKVTVTKGKRAPEKEPWKRLSDGYYYVYIYRL